ncbi:MAG: hypothetical protein L3K07_09495, partial [Thermoplasmata archaeon]|nr:hypothetical protein [Thermoplasmata archaeon]
ARMDRVKWNARFYTDYPAFATELLGRMMTETGAPKETMRATLRAARKAAKLSRWNLISDGYSLWRNF